MINLSPREAWFLIQNEDKMSLRKFAKRFKCTWQEVYEVYDGLTKTEEYKKIVRKRVEMCMKNIGGKNEQKVESNRENKLRRRCLKDELPRSLFYNGPSLGAASDVWGDNKEQPNE